MNQANVSIRKTLPHPGPLPAAAPLAKGEGELSADDWTGWMASEVERSGPELVRADSRPLLQRN